MDESKDDMSNTERQPQDIGVSQESTPAHVNTTPNKGLFHSFKRRLAAAGLGAVVGLGSVGVGSVDNAQAQNTTTDNSQPSGITAENTTPSNVSNIKVDLPGQTPQAETGSFDWINLIPKSEVSKDKVPMNPTSIKNFDFVMSHQEQQGENAQEIPANPDAETYTLNKVGTILEVTPDEEAKGVWVLVTTPGEKLTKITDGTTGETQYYGVTIDYFVQDDVTVKTEGSDKKEQGLAALAPHLKVGDAITFAFPSKGLDEQATEWYNTTTWEFDNTPGYPDTREKDTTGFKIKATTAIINPTPEK